MKISNLTKNNTIFLITSLCVGFLNYLYYPVLARLLDVSAFGDVQGLMAIFNIFNTVLVALSVIIVDYVSRGVDGGVVKRVFAEIASVSFYTSLALSGLILFFYREVGAFLGMHSYFVWVILVGLFLLSVPYVYFRALVQGEGRFGLVGAVNVLMSFLKIFLAVVLFYYGLGFKGVLFALVLAQVVSLVFLVVRSKQPSFIRGLFSFAKLDLIFTQKDRLWIMISAQVLVGFLSYGDIALAKQVMSGYEAGLYSGISTVATTIYFVCNAFVQVMFQAASKDVSRARSIFMKTLLFVLFSCLVAILFFGFFPDFWIRFLLGDKYVVFSSILFILGLIFSFVSIGSVCMHYLLVVNYKYLKKAVLLSFIILIINVLLVEVSAVSVWVAYLISSMFFVVFNLFYAFKK